MREAYFFPRWGKDEQSTSGTFPKQSTTCEKWRGMTVQIKFVTNSVIVKDIQTCNEIDDCAKIKRFEETRCVAGRRRYPTRTTKNLFVVCEQTSIHHRSQQLNTSWTLTIDLHLHAYQVQIIKQLGPLDHSQCKTVQRSSREVRVLLGNLTCFNSSKRFPLQFTTHIYWRHVIYHISLTFSVLFVAQCIVSDKKPQGLKYALIHLLPRREKFMVPGVGSTYLVLPNISPVRTTSSLDRFFRTSTHELLVGFLFDESFELDVRTLFDL